MGGRLHNALRFAGRAFVLLAIWGTIFGGATIAYYAYDMPDIRQVTQPQRRPAITLLADDGTVFKRYGDLAGQRVTLKDVPPDLV
ncbi:MAG TPA: carboxypeptidase, partial [Rhodospirillaceae bacterium]|nr:carboxypeptidase [Rhodospirillaceae bacterium]